MPDRSERLAIIVTAQNLASRALRDVNKQLGGMEKASWSAARAAKRGIGTAVGNIERGGIIAAGAAATAGAAVVKMAIDWEDAFAGVRKTVEGTAPQLAALNKGLLDLSTRVPIKATDLAAIAQQAGALGVPTNQVVKFTDVIARLTAATTGLSTEDAADAFGKLGNVLHFSGPDYERVASALVALGNAGASSEGDIIQIAKRFGAAGSQAKLSAAQVLGFSSAIASVGVEPEAAGSSLSRLFNNITKYIGTGSKKIDEFAKVSGVSVKTFSSLFAKDATGAVELFLKKLSGMDRFKASKALKAAGITNVRDINAVLLLSQNYGELKRQIDLATDAFAKNTELAQVSEERFKTTANQIAIFKNNVTAAGIEIGSKLLPVLNDLLKEGISWLQTHPDEIGRFGDQLAGGLRDAVRWAKQLDWPGIAKALKTAGGFAKGVVEAFASAPPWLQQAVITGWGLNKLTGGAVVSIGESLGAGIIGSLSGKLAGTIGGGMFSRGSSPANPMWVQSVGGGAGGPNVVAGNNLASTIAKTVAGAVAIGIGDQLVGMGAKTGGPGGAAEAAAGGGATIAGGALIAGPLGAIAGAALAVVDTQQKVAAQNSAIASDIHATSAAFLAQQPDMAALQSSLGAIDQGINDIQSNPLNVLVAGDSLDQLRQMRENTAAAIGQQSAANEWLAKGAAYQAAAAANGGKLPPALNGIKAAIDAEHVDLARQLGLLKSATDPKAIAAAAAAVTSHLTEGKLGNVGTTKEAISTLKTQIAAANKAGNHELAAALGKDLSRIERMLPGRQYAQRQLDKADRIVRSNMTNGQKIHELQGIERALKDRNLPHAVSRIVTEINKLKHAMHTTIKLDIRATGTAAVYVKGTSHPIADSDTPGPGKARGGPVRRGQLLRVNEQGGELLDLQKMRVIPAEQRPAALGYSAAAARAMAITLAATFNLAVTTKLSTGQASRSLHTYQTTLKGTAGLAGTG